MISIIGPGVIDVLAGAVDDKILSRVSSPMDFVEISFGGDALNEAVVLSRLGKQVQWISKVGDDEAGRRVLNYAEENNLSVECVKVAAGMATGISIALVDKSGERRFLTNSKCTMRNFEAADILPHVDHMAQIVSFASMFISYALDMAAMEKIFKRIKASGRTLAIDMKTPKNGETLEDLSGLLSCVDYFFPNESELATLTGSDNINK
ncbi:MAG: carbohydrate kinase family protein, partial [Selenomonadaceae bacterium]|nr:carbohydrate kinase family protein [Selenomonadaceae bacterium]